MENKQSNTPSDLPIKWEEYEYEHRPKSGDWFWYIASGALILIIVSILMKNFLLGIIAIAGALSVAVLGVQKPRKLGYAIESGGIRIGSQFHPFKEIDSFWISYEPPHKKELLLKSKKKVLKHMIVPLGNNNPKSIRDILKKVIKEEEQEESFVDILTEKMGL